MKETFLTFFQHTQAPGWGSYCGSLVQYGVSNMEIIGHNYKYIAERWLVVECRYFDSIGVLPAITFKVPGARRLTYSEPLLFNRPTFILFQPPLRAVSLYRTLDNKGTLPIWNRETFGCYIQTTSYGDVTHLSRPESVIEPASVPTV